MNILYTPGFETRKFTNSQSLCAVGGLSISQPIQTLGMAEEDALALLRREIEIRKRKLDAVSKPGTAAVRHILRADLERERIKEYNGRQQEREKQRRQRLEEQLEKYKSSSEADIDDHDAKDDGRRRKERQSPEKKAAVFDLSDETVEQCPMTTEQVDPEEYSSERTRSSMALFLRRLLRQWHVELEARTGQERASLQGRKATSTFGEAARYLKPLFKQLQQDNQLAPDVLYRVAQIVAHCQRREYVSANDAYLRLSIGNAPWPIGVTMVGIHERSAHDKLSNVAHALNDEATRKWIQSLKRLLTLCQRLHPPTNSHQRMG